EQRILVEEIVVRIRGQTELWKQDDGRMCVGGARRQIDRALHVERGIGHANRGDRDRDPDEAVRVNRIEPAHPAALALRRSAPPSTGRTNRFARISMIVPATTTRPKRWVGGKSERTNIA